VVLFADSRTVVKVVPTIGPKPTLQDMMCIKLAFWGVLRRLLAKDTAMPVSFEDAFPKIIAG
jgi:hypothetical protein